MSFLKKLFGGTAEDLQKKADAQFESGDFGSAKLTYEKALERSSDDTLSATLEARVSESRDGIARQRIEIARGYLERGDLEFATMELSGALEVSTNEEVLAEAQELIDSMEKREAVEQAAFVELGDDERRAMIIGQWEEEQGDELEALGEPLLDALLLLLDEETQEARAMLEALLEASDSPRYLYLEVAKARLIDEDVEGAEAAIASFLEGIGPEGGGEPRLNAHLTLARIADDRDDFEGTMAELQAAVEAIPGDPRPYLHMGNYLRRHGHGVEAIEVLESAIEVMDAERPHWTVLQELGLAQHAAGRAEAAATTLEQVLAVFTERGQTASLPPEATETLAEIHAEAGRLDRAADLYRHLATGMDREHHAHYHHRAGQLLAQLGLTDEARRMLKRAEALFGDDEEEARTALSNDLAGLDEAAV